MRGSSVGCQPGVIREAFARNLSPLGEGVPRFFACVLGEPPHATVGLLEEELVTRSTGKDLIHGIMFPARDSIRQARYRRPKLRRVPAAIGPLGLMRPTRLSPPHIPLCHCRGSNW